MKDKLRIVVDADTYLQGPSGYQDTYAQYLDLFEFVGSYDPRNYNVVVKNCPWSWVPVLAYLSAQIDLGSCKRVFNSCDILRVVFKWYNPSDLNRANIEMLSAARPETADALWRSDNVWKSVGRRLGLCTTSDTSSYEPHGIVVTTNASQYRPEILNYLKMLHSYIPPVGRDKVLLIPCSAEKPYPNTVQKRLKELLPDDTWYLMVVSGVLGLVPEDLFLVAPEYDAGIPMHWRVQEEVLAYFRRSFPIHSKVVCASEFYAQAINYAWLIGAEQGVSMPSINYIFPPRPRYDYEDLLSEENLNRIKQALI